MNSRLLLLPLFASLLAAQDFTIGSKIPDVALTDLKGASQTVHVAGSVPTVIIFTSTQCPVSNAYNDRMNQLYKEFRGTGFQFVFVNANQNESAEDIKKHLADHGLNYTVYRDQNNRLADRFGASVTPEAFLFDRDGVLRYHGTLDDSQNEARVKTTTLKNAIVAVMAGKTPEKAETKAFGCSIKRVRKATT
jgi:peroxiredoxin